MCSGNKHSRSFGGRFYFQDINFDSLCWLEYLAFYLLILCEDGIHFTEVDAHILSNITLNDTCYDIFLFAVVLIKKNFSLFLTDFL